MISIVKRKMKCSLCGKPGEGMLFKNLRLDRLPPVFLCDGCLERVRAMAGEPVPAAGQTREKQAKTDAGTEEKKSAARPERRKEEAI